MRSVMLPIALTIATVALAASASADPIVITAGRLGYDTGDPPTFVLSGEEFTATGLFPRLATPVPCASSPCPPGTSADLSARFGTSSQNFVLGQGVVTIGTNTYGTFGPGALVLRGELAFDVPSTLIPTRNEPGLLRLTAPFTFTGRLMGSGDPAATEPLFAVDLTGAGETTFALDPMYRFVGITYTFETAPVAPTPEPATAWLAAAAFVACWARQRFHNRDGNNV